MGVLGLCCGFRGFSPGELGQLRLAASYETLADCLPQCVLTSFSPQKNTSASKMTGQI